MSEKEESKQIMQIFCLSLPNIQTLSQSPQGKIAVPCHHMLTKKLCEDLFERIVLTILLL